MTPPIFLKDGGPGARVAWLRPCDSVQMNRVPSRQAETEFSRFSGTSSQRGGSCPMARLFSALVCIYIWFFMALVTAMDMTYFRLLDFRI